MDSVSSASGATLTGTRLRAARFAAAALLLLVCCPAAALTEELEYGWKLKGFGGKMIGLFFPA